VQAGADLCGGVNPGRVFEGQPAWHHDPPLQQHSLQGALVAAKHSHKVLAYTTQQA